MVSPVNLMLNDIWREAVMDLYYDQGMRAPTEFVVTVGVVGIKPDDLTAGERYLDNLNREERENFFIGEVTEVEEMVKRGGPDAEAAHRVLDQLFLLIGG